MKPKPLDDLEMFELLQAAYPGRFPDSGGDESFEAAQEFADNISGWEDVSDLLGRVAMLAMPMRSGLTNKLYHCLGVVTVSDGAAHMSAAVKREVEPPCTTN